ncbi:endonuclease V [Nocardioides sp.]|uniref:endonuclease V n=1 Tax=Nocardioides sp. TaxID=35761 RepID=UPI002ED2D272
MWPIEAESLIDVQQELARAAVEPWRPARDELQIGGCWVCFPRGLRGCGRPGDVAWAAAVVMRGGLVLDRVVRRGVAGAPYRPGLLALRIGGLMEATVRSLSTPPDVLLLDATARDHPRGAGLALHLGAELGLPTVGITHRPLLAQGEWPEDGRGDISPLRLGETVVGCWMRTRPGVRPVVVHPGWRIDLATAVDVVASTTGQRRTPEPLRHARRFARSARSAADGE